MQVIILCGGYGTRLKEETEFKPKPLVTVGGKPLLWHIIQMYQHHGFHEFILALGYKGGMIRSYCKENRLFDKYKIEHIGKEKMVYTSLDRQTQCTITFVDTGLDTLVGERVLRCEKAVPSDDALFLLTYGDGVADINISDVVSFHQRQNKIGTLCGVHPRSKYGLVTIDSTHKVTGFTEKPVLKDWVNGGFMVFERSAFSYFRSAEMEHEALRRMAEKNQLMMYPHEGFWFAVDTYKELADLNSIWSTGSAPWKVW